MLVFRLHSNSDDQRSNPSNESQPTNASNLFSLKWLRMTQNGQLHMIYNFSNLFSLKWLRMTWNGQFHLICNISNLFPLKLPRMTWNGQFCMAKIKCTLIQGNFYERLPFYMDSCALSPMASLFTIIAVLNVARRLEGYRYMLGGEI